MRGRMKKLFFSTGLDRHTHTQSHTEVLNMNKDKEKGSLRILIPPISITANIIEYLRYQRITG